MKQTLRKLFPKLFRDTAARYRSFGSTKDTQDRHASESRDVYSLEETRKTRSDAGLDRSKTRESDQTSILAQI